MKFLLALVALFCFLSTVSAQCGLLGNCTQCIGGGAMLGLSCGWCPGIELCVPTGNFSAPQPIGPTNGNSFCNFISGSTSGLLTNVQNCSGTDTCRAYASCSACVNASCGYCNLNGVPSCLSSGASTVCSSGYGGVFVTSPTGSPNCNSSSSMPSPCDAYTSSSTCLADSNCGWCQIGLPSIPGQCLSTTAGQSLCTSFVLNGNWTAPQTTTGVTPPATGTVSSTQASMATTGSSSSNGAQELAVSIFTLFVSLLFVF